MSDTLRVTCASQASTTDTLRVTCVSQGSTTDTLRVTCVSQGSTIDTLGVCRSRWPSPSSRERACDRGEGSGARGRGRRLAPARASPRRHEVRGGTRPGAARRNDDYRIYAVFVSRTYVAVTRIAVALHPLLASRRTRRTTERGRPFNSRPFLPEGCDQGKGFGEVEAFPAPDTRLGTRAQLNPPKRYQSLLSPVLKGATSCSTVTVPRWTAGARPDAAVHCAHASKPIGVA